MTRRTPILLNDVAAAWVGVLSRAMQAFAYYHWWSLTVMHPSIVADVRCISIRNAALESSIMSIRDLDDFFLSSPSARQDDLIASDFGFPAAKNFLCRDERDAINKKLAHLTYRSVHELKSDPLRRNPRTWNNADLVNRGMAVVLEFLAHLESSFFAGKLEEIGTICEARKTITSSLKNINAIARSEMTFDA